MSERDGRASRDEGYLGHLDYLRCYATILVVLLHVSAAGAYQWSALSRTTWWLATGFDAFARTCVPLFLLASGATLLDTAKVLPVGRFLMRRVRRIVVPLAFWSLVYLADRRWLLGQHMDWRQILAFLATGTTFYHLPFFYYLTGLYLSAPILAPFAASARGSQARYFVALVGAMASLQLAAVYSNTPFGLAVPVVAGFAGYFVMGRIFRDTAIGRGAVAACLVLVAVGWLATLVGTNRLTAVAGQLNELLFEYGSPGVLVMSVASYLILGSAPIRQFVADRPRLTGMVRKAARLTFGIFLVHPLILQIVVPRLNLGWNTGGVLIGVPLTTLVTLVLSGGLVWLVGRCPVIRRTVS